MTIRRMDNVLIVVDDLEAAKAFFVELGMELEGETTVEGPSVDRLIGLQNVRATLALMRTPDGHGRIELDKFHTPEAIRTGPENAPVNALGIRRIMFAVDDIDDVVARLLAHGAELVGEVVQYEDTYRLAYVRGPEGIIVGLDRAARLTAPRGRPAISQELLARDLTHLDYVAKDGTPGCFNRLTSGLLTVLGLTAGRRARRTREAEPAAVLAPRFCDAGPAAFVRVGVTNRRRGRVIPWGRRTLPGHPQGRTEGRGRAPPPSGRAPPAPCRSRGPPVPPGPKAQVPIALP